ncbi:hypothetical protein [Methylobacterium sp. J-068]|uniref:hypothetical protein n=1 Tax=Methylobacterium sp. J-068 TaxID=2836649 RepID=UPI001FB9CC15|nr:hypothetical protein [Methylobacterium sp. J-068]MCJ2034083.1 hypothetical protein [Methylobacterium sp. J-068]
MKNRIAAVAAALVLGAAPLSSAMAYGLDRYDAPRARIDVDTTGSIYGEPIRNDRFCAPSSASEGNANQQSRPVMQYGQTSGGTRC